MTDLELQNLANSLFFYDGENLLWKIRQAKRLKIGDIAGGIHPDGHRYVSFNGKNTGVHRIIFLIEYGKFPEEVDHKDGNGLNNKISNLRPSTKAQNQQNKGIYKNNTSGCKGISWKESKKTWVVRVQTNKNRKYIGSFKDLELAELVAMEARNKYHKEFARNV